MSLKNSHFSFPPQSIFYYFAGGGGRWGCYTIHSPLSVRVSTLYLSTSSLFTPSLSLSFLIFLRLSLFLSLYKSRKRRRPLFAKKAQKLLLFTSVDDSLILRLYFFLPSFSAMLKKFPFWELSLSLLLCFALLSSTSFADSDSDSDRLDLDHSNSSESNVSLSKPKEGSFAHMIDQALANEFPENDQPEGPLRSNLSLSLSLANSNYFRKFQFFFFFEFLVGSGWFWKLQQQCSWATG